MKQLKLVEPVIAIYSFASFLAYPLLQQYIYRRLWEQLNGSSYVQQDNVSNCHTNESDPTYIKQKEVQQMASHFFMYLDLTGLIPSLLVTLVLVAYSDRRGRKWSLLLPSVGALLSNVLSFIIAYFSLSLNFLFVSSFISGFFGSLATLLGGCFAYVADLCHDAKQKNIRMALVDMIIGLVGGIAALSSGFFLKAVGFAWPFLTTSLLQFFSTIYIIFFLEETIKVPTLQQQVTHQERIKEIFSGVYLLFRHSSCRKRILISLMLLTFMAYNFSNFGGISLFTLYELDTPLCWSEILIGYGSALSTCVFLTSFVGVFLFSRCMKDIYIVFIGLVSCIGGMIMTAFATSTVLMFLVRVPLLFAIMPLPVLRSMMSKIVLQSEHGALFACIACLESVSGSISFAVFSSIYAATVTWFPGFSFLLSAILCLIPLSILCSLLCLEYPEGEGAQALINEEESTEDGMVN
ncbi:lysosomal proton-coupled steroid conjugate and bile acid symporter SLC46A3 [Latimeria chalumnae]|uniref:Lysosomal proton-coupled steroid conjugate and bile acid symporter SLC46A3 n=1 Tax=Latimeria chalumnae TaxID=7897 RepID=M3XKZ5_LATCH|nr:PREDICTED: solute carrier family 46 member 3 [Latimeria chalumnae]|eukprot:XP_006012797.1 PREDICTED: solute carrier family 46 member 3 [Latimeria chalumnae]